MKLPLPVVFLIRTPFFVISNKGIVLGFLVESSMFCFAFILGTPVKTGKKRFDPKPAFECGRRCERSSADKADSTAKLFHYI
jgi:hypothetical protein